LIRNGQISSRDDLSAYTRLSYSRPSLNHQWGIFGNVLGGNLKAEIKDQDLLLFFGYLKRLLTIEAKKEGNKDNKQANGYGHRRDERRPSPTQKKR